ncbi:MAG: RHS repeat-associated core domain-containing protein [Anaerolineae bacterium]|nr:RHS repeat-associated core domain-containing protein [Anaerolineae bacterium]
MRVAESSGGVLYYLLTDHLGSTALTLDSSGARVTELRYYPFGAARYNAGNQVTTYRFTGQRWDSGTALYFYQSRWYDPLIGRFLAADTIVPQPQNPQNLNRYSYVGNQPLRFVDPSGHAGVDFWGGGGDAGAGIGLVVALIMTQAQGAVYQYGPVAAEITWLYGNQTIAAGDQISQAVQNAGQGGNTAGPGGLDPNDPRFKQGTEQAAQTQGSAVTSRGLNVFSRAAEFGIKSYNQLSKMTSATGLRAHHLIEQRFAERLGLNTGRMSSIALTPEEHQIFTNMWRAEIGHIGDRSALTTATATLQDVWTAAQRIYAQHPELLEAVRQDLFGQ